MKQKIRKIRNIIGIVLCAFMITMFAPHTVKAAGPVDVGSTVSLKVNYRENGRPITGVRFELYKVAEMDEHGRFSLLEEFEKYPISLDIKDSAEWKLWAQTMAYYIRKDQVEAIDTAMTDENGVASFPAEQSEMTTGLYLVLGERFVAADTAYIAEPAPVSLPNLDTEGKWDYSVEIDVKHSTEIEEIADLQVVKQWKDDGKNRPEEIEIELLQGKDVFETVTLNANNGWRYVWEELGAGTEWSIVEKDVPEGYTVTVDREDNTFIVTNTYEEESGLPDDGDKEDTDKEDTDNQAGGSTGGGGQKLPQTGMLWWPVPVLVLFGISFFVIGWVKRRRSGE